MELINKLAGTAAAGGAVEKGAFMAGALREMSVCHSEAELKEKG